MTLGRFKLQETCYNMYMMHFHKLFTPEMEIVLFDLIISHSHNVMTSSHSWKKCKIPCVL